MRRGHKSPDLLILINWSKVARLSRVFIKRYPCA
jgi:hypothetical protein